MLHEDLPTVPSVNPIAVEAKRWCQTTLGAVATLQRGFDLPYRDRKPGTVPVITSAGPADFHSDAQVRGPGVVTGRYGTIGEVFLVEEDFWPLNTTLYVKDFHGNDPRFVAYLLRTIDFRTHSGKSGVPGVNRNDLHQLPIRLPPLNQQRQIAGVLTDLECLLARLDTLIVKKRDLKQAAMQQLLTGRSRLPGFAGAWRSVKLGDLAAFSKGRGLPKSAIRLDGSEPCIHYGELFTQYRETIDLVRGRTNHSDDAVLSIAHDVLMPTSDVTPRGLAKASCILSNGVVLGGDILIIRPKPSVLHGPFLSHLIRYEEEQIMQLVTGSTVFHIYASDMKNFQFSCPSVEEQAAIVGVLGEMGAQLTSLEARHQKTLALKQAMMQQLLTGRIRLI